MFPRSHHRPSLITTTSLAQPVQGRAVKRWNFRKANWAGFTEKVSQAAAGLLPPCFNSLNDTYDSYCKMLLAAARNNIPRGVRKACVPCWDEACENLLRSHTEAQTSEDRDKAADELLCRLTEKCRKPSMSGSALPDRHHSTYASSPTPHCYTRPGIALHNISRHLQGFLGEGKMEGPVEAIQYLYEWSKSLVRMAGTKWRMGFGFASLGKDLRLSLDQFAAECEMADMCTAECNITDETNSTSYQLQLVNSTPLRSNISMAITQFFVWPFIYMDMFMLLTFYRKQAFRTETRYILFSQTLLIDFIFLLLTDFVMLISYSHILMPVVFCVPVCMVMETVTICTPMIITAMCVERYVAICMPLRHSALSTSSRTCTAIFIIWIVSTIMPLMDLIILVSTVSQDYLSQLTFCYYEIMTPEKWHRYMRVLLCVIRFIIILLVELFCYVLIMLAARAASVDKKSASKGLRTVSLHMLQLILCTMEIICPYIEAVVIQLDIQVYLSVRFFNFITFSVIARAVSPLVYGIRDEEFYTAFVYNIQCGQNHMKISTENRILSPA
ncbi:uncharacterized protein LOC143478269 [Brachyhypopomus gauderio]|uniref:uncharacterized protein LOC143478269 n=1 Tax=Brachyhypopomus gauderio TaxID=698409 RepID=UPI0040417C57